MTDTRRFLDRLNRRPGAKDAVIDESEKRLGVKLPTEYVEFLRFTDGGEGFVGKEYVILWAAEELALMNQSYEVQKYVPGLLIFGSNGGGEAYGFDTRDSRWSVVRVPFVGMEWNDAEPMGPLFSDFLQHLFEAE